METFEGDTGESGPRTWVVGKAQCSVEMSDGHGEPSGSGLVRSEAALELGVWGSGN